MKKKLYPFLVLTKAELEQLKGGNTEFVETSINPGTDVVNANSVDYCHCSYDNYSLVKNSNSVDTCYCMCTKAPVLKF